MVSQIARATLSAFGIYKSSRVSLNGTGVWGGVTIRIGALSDPKPCCATSAETSVAMLQRGEASSTTTRRPVLGDAFENAVLVERRGGPEIDHLTFAPGAGQSRGGFLDYVYHAAQRHHGHVTAFARESHLAERNRIRFLGNFALLE